MAVLPRKVDHASARRSTRHARRIFAAGAIAAAAMSVPFQIALATDGTWINASGGTWGNPANWAAGVIANGTGAVANFAPDIPDGDAANYQFTNITLGSPRTVGKLVLLDTSGGSFPGNFLLTGSTLTLAVTAGTPTIDTPGSSAQYHDIESSIAGTQGLNKTGAGFLFLGNANGYTGLTSLLGGGLVVGNSGALGGDPSAVNIGDPSGANAATLQLFDGISLTRNLHVVSGGTGAVELSMPFPLGYGTFAGNVTLDRNASFTVNDGTLAVSGSIGGSGRVVVSSFAADSGGTVLLFGANNYAGGTTINSGILQTGAANTLPLGRSVDINPGIQFARLSLGSFNQSIGALVLHSGASTGTFVTSTGGVLTLGGDVLADNSFGTAPVIIAAPLNLGGANRTFSASNGNNAAANGDLQILAPISGNGGVNIGVSGGIVTFGASNSYTASTTVSGGTLYVGDTSAIPAGSALVVGVGTTDAAVVDLTDGGRNVRGYTASPGSLSGTGTIITGNSAGAGLVVGSDNSSPSAFSGVITGSGQLRKVGTGTLALSGTNTYTGTTTVAAGALMANADAPSAAPGVFGNAGSDVVLGDASTTANNASPALLIGGAVNIARPITISANPTTGTYIIGGTTANSGTFSGLVTVNNNLTITQAATSGGHALNILGGITSATAGLHTITFAGPGAINVAGAPLSDGNGGGTLAVTVTGGISTFAASNNYTGATIVAGGTLDVSGSLASSTITIDATSGPANLVLDGGNALPPTAQLVAVGPNAFVPTINVNASQTIGSITSAGVTQFNAGSSVVGPIDGTGSISAIGGNLTAVHIRHGALNIGSLSTVAITASASPGSANATSIVGALAIDANGTLDINNNSIGVTYSSGASPYASIKSAITSAYDGGAWDQPGINSTSARNNAANYGIGYAEASALGSTSLDGQTFAGNAVLVKYTLLGDADLSGTVDGSDYNTVIRNFNKPGDWQDGNFDYTGTVNGADYNAIIRNFNKTATGSARIGPVLSKSHSIASAATPAPTKTDIHIEVNTTTGDVSFQGFSANPAQFSLYNITSQSSSLVAPNLTTLTGRYPNWAVIQTKSKGIAEGQGLTYSSTDSGTWDTITLQLGKSIDLGNIFKVGGSQDLAFEWNAPQAGTGDPVAGITFSGAPVDYLVAPEPTSASLLGLGAIGLLRRRRRWAM